MHWNPLEICHWDIILKGKGYISVLFSVSGPEKWLQTHVTVITVF